jgi:hypothetical protein
VAYADTLVYLYTGRPAIRVVVPSVLFYRRGGLEKLWEPFRNVADYGRYGADCLMSARGDYFNDEVISDHDTMEDIFAKNRRLDPIFTSPETRVYRIDPSR